MTEKEDAIIEQIDNDEPNKVAVLLYDTEGEQILTTVIDLTTRNDAESEYNIVGELIDGSVRLKSDESVEEFDYESYTGVDIDEDE